MLKTATKQFWENMIQSGPYNLELGLKLVSAEEDCCVLELPYRENLVGNPETGVLHGGVITALLDVTFCFATLYRLSECRPMATLDLRIDYLRPATPGMSVYAGAVCHKLTAQLAFIRGAAYHDTPHDPISTGVGIYMFTDSVPPTKSRG